MNNEAAATATAAEQARAVRAVRVWDLPTRLFHWALALAVVGLVVTAKIGGAAMVFHFRLGLFVMGLLLFRLVWGLIGGHWSRFTSFVYMPWTILRYLRGGSRPGEHHDVGHNPLGSLSVLAMLAILIVQVSTGLVADDEISNVGPLNKFVASTTAALATSWHKTWGQWIVLALVATHIVAIVAYLTMKKVNLVRPMLSGDKDLSGDVPSAQDHLGRRLLALALALAVAAVVIYIGRLGG